MSSDEPRYRIPTLEDLLIVYQRWSRRAHMDRVRRSAESDGDTENAERARRFVEVDDAAGVPTALEALAAQQELVEQLAARAYLTTRAAREAGASWTEIARATRSDPTEAREDYLRAVHMQISAAQRWSWSFDGEAHLAVAGPWQDELRTDTPAETVQEIERATARGDTDMLESLRRDWWDPTRPPLAESVATPPSVDSRLAREEALNVGASGPDPGDGFRFAPQGDPRRREQFLEMLAANNAVAQTHGLEAEIVADGASVEEIEAAAMRAFWAVDDLIEAADTQRWEQAIAERAEGMTRERAARVLADADYWSEQPSMEDAEGKIAAERVARANCWDLDELRREGYEQLETERLSDSPGAAYSSPPSPESHPGERTVSDRAVDAVAHVNGLLGDAGRHAAGSVGQGGDRAPADLHGSPLDRQPTSAPPASPYRPDHHGRGPQR